MGSFSTSLFTLDLFELSFAHQLANPSQTMERIGQKFRNNYCVAGIEAMKEDKESPLIMSLKTAWVHCKSPSTNDSQRSTGS
jgi:hypothetical protein